MSQHDYSIANAAGSAVRTDINNALGAIQTTNIGSSAPSSVAAGQLWIDNSATPWVLKCYDGSDHISIGTINASTNAFSPSGVATTLSGTALTGLTNLESDAIEVKSQKIQFFFIKIANVGGTIKHSIFAEWLSLGVIGNYSGQITGASQTATTTPTVDGSTDFATGCGVNGPVIVFNTAAQVRVDAMAGVTIAYNSTGTQIQASTYTGSRNVNGTTRIRLEVKISEVDGSNFDLNTTNISSGKYIVAHIQGYLA